MTQPSIRASSLPEYSDCARRAAAKQFSAEITAAGYELKNIPKMIGAAIGTGAHASFQYTLQTKIDEDSLGFNDIAEQKAIAALEKEMDEGVRFDDMVPTRKLAEEQVLRLSKTIRTQVAPRINPVKVELELKAEYRGFLITGHIDVLEPTDIGDLKTGKFMRQNLPQYGCYSMLLGSVHYGELKSIKEAYIPTVPLTKPTPAVQYNVYDINQAEVYAHNVLDYMIDDYTRFMEKGDRFVFRANPQSILCSPKYCKAYGTNFCKEHLTKENV